MIVSGILLWMDHSMARLIAISSFEKMDRVGLVL